MTVSLQMFFIDSRYSRHFERQYPTRAPYLVRLFTCTKVERDKNFLNLFHNQRINFSKFAGFAILKLYLFLSTTWCKLRLLVINQILHKFRTKHTTPFCYTKISLHYTYIKTQNLNLLPIFS